MTHLAGILNVAGICTNMVGVVVLFFFAFPQPTHDQGVGLGLEGGNLLPNGMTVAEHNDFVRRRRVRYRLFAAAGVGLLVVGFLLQMPAAVSAIT